MDYIMLSLSIESFKASPDGYSNEPLKFNIESNQGQMALDSD